MTGNINGHENNNDKQTIVDSLVILDDAIIDGVIILSPQDRQPAQVIIADASPITEVKILTGITIIPPNLDNSWISQTEQRLDQLESKTHAISEDIAISMVDLIGYFNQQLSII